MTTVGMPPTPAGVTALAANCSYVCRVVPVSLVLVNLFVAVHGGTLV